MFISQYQKLIIIFMKNFIKYSFCESKVLRNKKLIIKPFSVFENNFCMSLVPLKATFIQKLQYISAKKTGAILVEMMPYVKEPGLQKYSLIWQKKIVFAINPNNLGYIIGLSDDIIANKTINTKIQYTKQGSSTKTLSIRKGSEIQNFIEIQIHAPIIENKNLTLQNLDVSKEQKFATYQIKVTKGQLVGIRELCRYSLPYLLGWQILNSTRYAQLDSNF